MVVAPIRNDDQIALFDRGAQCNGRDHMMLSLPLSHWCLSKPVINRNFQF